MADKYNNDISADELLAKLKANMEDGGTKSGDGKKRYRFRKTEKTASPVTEEEIKREMPESDTGFVSPVPKSEIADLDIDALMKKYLPQDEYEKFSGKSISGMKEDEFVDSLSSAAEDENPVPDGSGAYAAPDTELFSTLSEGGKVCDIPGEGDTAEMPGSTGDTAEVSDSAGAGDTVMFDTESGNESAPEAAEGQSAPSAPGKTGNDGNETVVFSLNDVPEQPAPSELPAPEEENVPELPGNEAGESGEIIGNPENLPGEAIAAASEENGAADPDGFDETDANLMLAFGMEDELEKAMGKENADRLRSDMEKSIPEDQTKKKKVREEKPGELREFITPAEAKGIFENYKTAFGKNALSLFAMAAVVIVLFFYENIITLGGHLPDALNPVYYPVVNVMVGLQFLFIGAGIAYRSLIKGIRGLIDRKPVPESFIPLILLVSVIFAVCVCFFSPDVTPVTFNFPASLCLLFAVLNERMDLRREIMSFNIISSKRTKFALEKLELGDAELETKAFDKFLPKQPAVFKINKTGFIDGYFRRTKAYPSTKLVLKAFIPASAAIAAASLVMGAILLRDWQSAVMLAYTAFFFSLPATVFIAFGLPAFRASRLAFAENSAFVGESALDEYTTAGSISFDDREVFPTAGVKLRSVKVFGSGRIDTVIYNVASIYSVLGGPLSDVLNVATADLGRSEDTEILSVDNEGVEALVDGKHLYAGKADYLRKNGYVPVSDPDDEEIVSGGEISIMYLVCDDEVIAKLYIRYRIDPGFEVTVKRLYKSGICVGIKTVDPNINDEMLSTKIKLAKYPVRVLKYSDISGSRRGSDRTDSGIVSKKSAKALLSVFTLCDRIKHVTKTNIAVDIITMITGLAVCIATAVIGSVVSVPSLYVALFQLFWLIPVYLMSKFMLL